MTAVRFPTRIFSSHQQEKCHRTDILIRLRTGLRTQSGEHLTADIIVTATGLNLVVGGGEDRGGWPVV